jgi:type I restriction enzyme S subunit
MRWNEPATSEASHGELEKKLWDAAVQKGAQASRLFFKKRRDSPANTTKSPRGRTFDRNDSLPTQRKIEGALSAYDDLIKKQPRRIRILEEMAQSLYREWFVHFRFPRDPSEASAKADGHESVKLVDSALGMIPKGWEMKSAGESIGFHVGGGWRKDVHDENHSEPAFVIRGTDISSSRLCDRSSVLLRYHSASNLRSRRLEEGDIPVRLRGR